MKDYKNPWQTLSSTDQYDNPWINVCEHQVINPAGGPGIYGVVTFKNKAVGVIPVDDEGYTWLVGQWRYPLNQYSWEIPEGGSPEGEDPVECARRELQEETGLSAQEYIPLMELHPSNSICNETAYLYVAKGLTQGEHAHEDTEDITIRKVKLDDAIKMAMDGEITDAMSVAALLKLALLRGQFGV